MTQAENYMQLLEQLGGQLPDASYGVALYILSSDARLTKIALPHISSEGIGFPEMLKQTGQSERDTKLLQIAYSLFHYSTPCYPSPHDLSQLGLPYLDIVIQAIYLASGLHQLRVIEDAEGAPVLEISTEKHREAKRIQAGFARFMQAAMAGEG